MQLFHQLIFIKDSRLSLLMIACSTSLFSLISFNDEQNGTLIMQIISFLMMVLEIIVLSIHQWIIFGTSAGWNILRMVIYYIVLMIISGAVYFVVMNYKFGIWICLIYGLNQLPNIYYIKRGLIQQPIFIKPSFLNQVPILCIFPLFSKRHMDLTYRDYFNSLLFFTILIQFMIRYYLCRQSQPKPQQEQVQLDPPQTVQNEEIQLKIPNEECCICLEELVQRQSVKTKCEHYFHQQCLEQWLQQNQTCPQCRGQC